MSCKSIQNDCIFKAELTVKKNKAMKKNSYPNISG